MDCIFSRNFGKEAVISAGFASAAGDAVVVIDCDLQHPPEKIVEMYCLWQEGYEIVEGIKKQEAKKAKCMVLLQESFIGLSVQ